MLARDPESAGPSVSNDLDMAGGGSSPARLSFAPCAHEWGGARPRRILRPLESESNPSTPQPDIPMLRRVFLAAISGDVANESGTVGMTYGAALL